MIRLPPCSRVSAQAVASSSSRHIAPTPWVAMPSRSSVNQARWSVVAVADAADHRVVADLARR